MSAINEDPSIAANARIGDQLVVDAIILQQRTAQFDGAVSVAATQSATGLALDVYIGGRLASLQYKPIIKATAPVIPDDVVGSFPIRKGEQISLGVSNSTGGALVLFYKLDVPG